MEKIAGKLTDLIGNTPLLELRNYEKAEGLEARVVAKLEAFNPLSSDRYTTGTINHIYDDKLQELLATAYAMSTAGEEPFKALHDYVVENAYGMNLVNYTTTYVVPSFMDSVCLSYKKSFIPGGCTYIEQ